MTILTIGDMAMSFQTRNQNFRIKSEMLRLGNELTTGLKSDLRAATGGNLGALSSLEHQLGTLAAYKVAANEAGTFADATQRALETVQQTSSDLGPALLMAGSTGQATQIQTAAVDARAKFAMVVSILNTQVADRPILAGTSGSGRALADAETMLASLGTAVAAETTAAGVEAAVVAWFDTAGGGFDTDGYLGSETEIAPFRIGPDEQASMGLSARDPRIVDLLKGYAMAALVADGALSTDHDARVALIENAANRLLTSDRAVAEMRSGVGTVQAQIDAATARNGAESSALEMARNDIVAADPYQAASELQAVQTRLEALYTITARLSRLSLTEYLR